MHKTRKILLTCLVSAAALVFAGLTWQAQFPDVSSPIPDAAALRSRELQRQSEIKRTAIARAEKSLAWADRECKRAVLEQLTALDKFFIQSRQGTPGFAEVVLSWGSKWRFVADKMPFTKGGRHEAFLRSTFEEHIFQASELSASVEQVLRGFADQVEAIENRMLVRIQEDLADLPRESLPAFSDEIALKEAYDQALSSALAHVGSDVSADVGTLVASLVAQEVLTQVAVRLGVSAGVLGVGAGSSWATLGVGLVVGLIVDQIITWVWDWWSDPEGSLADDLNQQLDTLQRLIVEGEQDTPGLRARLLRFARERQKVRRVAVLTIIEQGSR